MKYKIICFAPVYFHFCCLENELIITNMRSNVPKAQRLELPPNVGVQPLQSATPLLAAVGAANVPYP